MDRSRRGFCLLTPVLFASATLPAEESHLPSKTYRFQDLPVNASGQNAFRPVLEGLADSGCRIELHETDLAPGGMPHPAHRHQHEEMFLIREGTVEVTLGARKFRLGPGGVAFVASNEEHGIHNAGTTHAQYFVIALGSDTQ